MGVKDVLSRKAGVIVGDDVLNLFKYAQEKAFAIPAIVSRLSVLQSPDIITLIWFDARTSHLHLL